MPTRWTVNKLIDSRDCCLQATCETEMKAKAQGVKVVMSSFQFLFSCFLYKMILKETDNLSKTLQNATVAAALG